MQLLIAEMCMYIWPLIQFITKCWCSWQRFSSGMPFLFHTGEFLMTLNFTVTKLQLTACAFSAKSRLLYEWLRKYITHPKPPKTSSSISEMASQQEGWSAFHKYSSIGDLHMRSVWCREPERRKETLGDCQL